jgi:hypothetical protein
MLYSGWIKRQCWYYVRCHAPLALHALLMVMMLSVAGAVVVVVVVVVEEVLLMMIPYDGPFLVKLETTRLQSPLGHLPVPSR